MAKLNLDREMVDRCRELAASVVHPTNVYINRHSTIAVERAVLRLLGFNGEYKENGGSYPVVNLIVEKIGRKGIKNGVAAAIAEIKNLYPRWTQQKMGEQIISGEVNFEKLEELPQDKMESILRPWIDNAIRHIDKIRHTREEVKYKLGSSHAPLKCVVVGSGSVDEDIQHAELAIKQGADVVAVTRSTAQSLLDYVPEGATQEGFGGTFATQENFRLMHEALEDFSYKAGRYVRLCHYSSGLCMPELAVMAAVEGVDYIVNDSLYGVLFRDINVKRSLIDQHFSRMIVARAGIVINTAEDNLLRMADAYTNHHQVLASHFLNEIMAKNAGVRDDQIGLSHSYEMDPKGEDNIVFEVAMAQLVREVFSRCPIRYMPPTSHKEEDLYFSNTLDTVFNMLGMMTGQNIQFLGKISGLQASPLSVQERHVALKNAKYVFNGCRSFVDEITFSANGKIMRHARQILENTHKFLKKVDENTFFGAIEDGAFVGRQRDRDGGNGFNGVFERSRTYYNPFMELVTPTTTGRR